MSRPSLRAFTLVLAASLLAFAVAAMAATPPTLFTLSADKAEVLAQGTQKSWPITLSESNAFDAVFQGGLWIPTPSGGREYAKYDHHILHANGTWTWVGEVSTVHGDQPVVLTFGKGSVFGLVPQASGYPLRIVTRNGQSSVVETSAAMARSAQALRLQSEPDYLIPPQVAPKGGNLPGTTPSIDAAPPVAAAAGPVTIDVMVAYTQGFATMLGGQGAAIARIQNLVDITNTAYTASGVNQQIRLVYALQVNYPDNTGNQSALTDITGVDTNGNKVPIPASLQNIAALRDQYGADLVTLIRAYDNSTQGNCGIGWLNGANETPIVPGISSAYGYNEVSDGSSGGYYCLDTTFAHELGHNMGSAHDRANAANPGAYSYSYGYVGNGANGFSTIMAYGTATTSPLPLFSNPDISTCQNTPCGVADAASDSADNAHSLNNTAPLIAQFRSTTIGTPPPLVNYVHNDIDGNGTSDLLWYNAATHQMTYWLMNGATMNSWQALNVPAGYTPIATGDFNGDGYADILWTDTSGNVYMWLNNGGGAFTSSLVTAAIPGWQIVGTTDINDDGETDLIWYNSSAGQMTYWLMNGANLVSWQLFQTSPGLQLLTTGDFDGSGYGDILWKTPSGDMYMWLFNSRGTFNYYKVSQYPAGWILAGTGDVNGDGKTDLFWYNANSGQMTYWLMNGSTLTSWQLFNTNAGLTPLATGVFDGTNAGLTWKVPSGAMYMWLFNKSNPTALRYYQLSNYPAGWVPIP